ncbi:PP2A regulatory subunit TAP46 [Trifolium repens]|nr:PP2A regulatory subunit TAP46 [Trifolium repens]
MCNYNLSFFDLNFCRLLGDPFFEPLCFYPELQNNKENRPRNRRQHNEVPYYLAELTEKIAQDDRIQILKASQAKLKVFISFGEAMELRARKIARFKRQKAAESKLLEIKERKERRGRSTRAAALSTPVEAGEEELLDDDGQEERESWNTSISLAICKAFDLLDMIKKEEEMLLAVKDRQSKVVKCSIARFKRQKAQIGLRKT